MPAFAQFVAITASDEGFILPDPQSGDIDISFQNIDLVDLDRTRTAVAMFTATGNGTVRLRMRFNSGNDRFIDFTSVSATTRTCHEVFRGEDLQISNNELTISVSRADGTIGLGRVRLSDIVIFYHATAP